jgi:hypothetical protein
MDCAIKKPALSDRLCDCQQTRILSVLLLFRSGRSGRGSGSGARSSWGRARSSWGSGISRGSGSGDRSRSLFFFLAGSNGSQGQECSEEDRVLFHVLKLPFVKSGKTVNGNWQLKNFGSRAHIVLKMRKISIVFIVHEDSLF